MRTTHHIQQGRQVLGGFANPTRRTPRKPGFRRSAWLRLENLEDRTTPVAYPLAPQFTVAAVTGSEAAPPAVAIVNLLGDFVATWESFETDGSGIGVYAQRFQADGTPIGTPAMVNSTTQGNQSRPTIASNANGGVVIAWQGESATGGAYDIFYKTGDFNAGATWLSATEVMVNVVTTGAQTVPTAAMDASGKFVIAWQSDQDLATTGIDVYARYGTLAGGLIGSADVAVLATAGDQKAPEAVMAAINPDGSGTMLIAYTGPGPTSEEGEATNVVRGTLYAYNAAFDSVTPTDAAHTDYQLTAVAQHDQVQPDVAMAPDGRFVLVWQAEGQQGSGSDVFSRRFAANGNGLDATNVLVNTVTAEPQRYPSIGIDAEGDYFVSWQSQGADSRSWGILGRAFNADGSQARADFIINVNEQGPQTNPAVAVAPNGKSVVIWAGPFVPTHGGTEGEEGVEGEGGHQPAVFGRLFNATGTVDVPPAATALNVNGLEFQVAAVGAGEDVPAAAAACTDGNTIVVWQAFEETEDPSGYGIYGQRVAADGTLIGTKFLINQTTLGYQSHPTVAALPGGGFVAVWQAEIRGMNPGDPSHYDLYARLYTLDGMGALTAGDEFLVNQATTTGQQTLPAVASDAVGSLVVVWQTDAQAADEYGTEIYARRYTASGTTATPLAAEFRVNTQTAATVTPTVTGEAQVAPVVAMNAAGQFAVAWVSDHNVANDPGDTEKSIFVRWFGADGVAPAPEFLATVYTKDAQEHPEVGIDANGDLVVAWQSINQETGGMGVSWGVFARQFQIDTNGVATPVQANEFQVNQTVAAPQRFAAVGMTPEGHFSIAWQTINQDGSSWAVFQRQFRPDGTPETGEEIVNTVTSGPQILPVYARKANGDYAIFWSGTAADHVDGIAGRIFDNNNAPAVDTPGGMLPAVNVDQNAPPTVINLHALFIDDHDADGALTYEVVGNTSPALLSSVSFDAATGKLTLAYAANAHGAAVITLRVTDTAGLSVEAPLTVTVTRHDQHYYAGASGPLVVVHDALTGAERFRIFPYVGYQGEVRVAVGDVTDDGIDDIITGAAVNAHVMVFDGATGTMIASFLAYPGYGGGVYVAAGDVNGDGNADIITGAGANGHVKVFDGATGGLLYSFLAYGGYGGEVRVAAGDTDGDGRADIITGAAVNAHVKVFNGASGAEVASFLAYPGFGGGIYVAAGDVNGDGLADIVTGAGPGAGPHVKVFSGTDLAVLDSFFAFGADFSGGVRVGTTSCDGDAFAELITATGTGTQAHAMIWDGQTLGLERSFALPGFTGLFVGGGGGSPAP